MQTSLLLQQICKNSTRVQAGPVLAEPPDFKRIKKNSQDIKAPTSK